MLVRSWNVFVVVFWLMSMSALFYLDILPSWLAGEAPVVSVDAMRHMRRDRQAGIFNPAGKRVGTNWVRYISTHELVMVKSTTLIEGLLFFPPLRILTRLTFRDEGVLDEFSTRVLGAPMKIELKGENYEPDFACELRAGEKYYRWRMDSESSQMLSEVFRPLSHLPDLHVGRSWRLRVVNPLAVATGRGPRFDVVLVRVTGTETIDHHGRPVECFVVESPQLKAFVEPIGEVLRQEFDVPGFGRFTLVDEPFDEQALIESAWRAPVRSTATSPSGPLKKGDPRPPGVAASRAGRHPPLARDRRVNHGDPEPVPVFQRAATAADQTP